MRPDHISFQDFEAAFQNVSDNKMAMYMSRQFLEFNIRTKMTDG